MPPFVIVLQRAVTDDETDGPETPRAMAYPGSHESVSTLPHLEPSVARMRTPGPGTVPEQKQLVLADVVVVVVVVFTAVYKHRDVWRGVCVCVCVCVMLQHSPAKQCCNTHPPNNVATLTRQTILQHSLAKQCHPPNNVAIFTRQTIL